MNPLAMMTMLSSSGSYPGTIVPPRGHGQCLERRFGLPELGGYRGCHWHRVGGGLDAANLPTMHSAGPRTKRPSPTRQQRNPSLRHSNALFGIFRHSITSSGQTTIFFLKEGNTFAHWESVCITWHGLLQPQRCHL